MLSRLVFLPIGLFLIWCVVSQQWYVCHIKNACGGDGDQQQQAVQPSATATPLIVAATPIPAPEPTATPDNRPLVFTWNKADAITRESFGALKAATLADLADDQLLEIQGLYYSGETAPAGFANMGLARAAAVKALFVPPLDAARVIESSRLISNPSVKAGDLFHAAAFSTRERPQEDVVEIVELDDQITIHFPLASAQREPDERIDDYLEQLAARLKVTSAVVQITGHTDNAGSREFNFDLGMKRAQHIADTLQANGIDAGKMRVLSQGESQPMASNDAREGRRQNRRVEIELISE